MVEAVKGKRSAAELLLPDDADMGTLAERTTRLLAKFDGVVKDYAYHDSGDANAYATRMADLLDEWLEHARTRCRGSEEEPSPHGLRVFRHPPKVQGGP
jgi:hypothetical protein